jgi:hypothetical protein
MAAGDDKAAKADVDRVEKALDKTDKRVDTLDTHRVTAEVTMAKLDLRVATIEVNVAAIKRLGYWALLLLLAGIATPLISWLLKGGVFIVPTIKP